MAAGSPTDDVDTAEHLGPAKMFADGVKSVMGDLRGQVLSVAADELVAVVASVIGPKNLTWHQAEQLGRGLKRIGKGAKTVKTGHPSDEIIITKLDAILARLDANPPSTDGEWVSVERFAELINRRPYTITHEYCKKGLVRCRKLDPDVANSPWRIHRSEADRFKIDGFRQPVGTLDR